MTDYDYKLNRPQDRKNGAYPDAIGAWIAEMDFAVADPIREVLQLNLDASYLAYVDVRSRKDILRATSEYLEGSFGWQVSPTNIFYTADIISGYEAVIRTLLAPDAPIVIPRPAYTLLRTTPRYFDREMIEVDCLDDGKGNYSLDFEAIDKALRPGALFVLTNPYNPIGKVFTRAELEHLAQIVDKNGALVYSDEVHAPLIFDKEAQHVPYASISEVTAAHTITAFSASKAFNIPGLKTAQLIFTNPELRNTWKHYAGFYADGASRLGLLANIAAYTDPRSEQWLAAVRDKLRSNYATLCEHFAVRAPELVVAQAQATYLIWIDCRAFDLPTRYHGNLCHYLTEQAQVVVNDGSDYGTPGYIRLNIAMEPDRLELALDRILNALS